MATMRRFCAAAALAATALLLTACAGVPASSERVLSFHSDITVQPDGTVAVRETIKVRSGGIILRHGIVRGFPGEAADSGFRLADVLLDGQPAEHSTRTVQGGLRLYVGREDELLPQGEHTYTIAFQTALGLSTEAGRRVLRWRVTGYEWPLPIDAASASLELPASTPMDSVHVEAVCGPPAASKNEVAYSAGPKGRLQFEANRALGIGEGMRILVSWPAATADAVEGPRQQNNGSH